MAIRTVIGGLLALAVVATGCTTTDGRPVAATSAGGASSTTTSSRTSADTTTSEAAPATPTGQPIGTATMKVSGGVGPVTIRYQINGGSEQTETNVTLPWEKEYPVYDEVQTSVSADGGDAELICTIIMDGKLASFESEPRPTCSFAYYG